MRPQVGSLLTADSVRESGFVTFDTLFATCVARQALHDAHWHDVTSGMTVTDAPPPPSIIWTNLAVRFNERRRGELWAIAVSLAITFLWTLPTILLSTLASLDRLKLFFPGPPMSTLLEHETVAAFISGTLPGLLLIATMSLLPYILRFTILFLPVAPQSEIEIRNWVIGRYFFFLLFNVFLVSTVSGSIWKSLETWLRYPDQISAILGKSLPGTAPFFISYILLKAGSFSIQLCRFSDCGKFLLSSAGTLTPRQKRTALGMDPVDNVMQVSCRGLQLQSLWITPSAAVS